MKITVVGIGPGAIEQLTPEGARVLKEADIVITSMERTKHLTSLNENIEKMGVMDTVSYINANKDKDMKVAVAASGDTGFYSIASTIKKLSEGADVSFLPGISSMTYFFSKIGMSYEKAKLVSAHGRSQSLLPLVCYNEVVFSLTGGKLKAHDHLKTLVNVGLGHLEAYVGENLSMSNEKIYSGSVEELEKNSYEDLAVLIVVNHNYVNRYKTLRDSDFVRGKSPMTKEPLRVLSLGALEIEPDDVVYDIGAGTGAMTCAMAKEASSSMVYAIEKNPEGCLLVKENMKNLGIHNIEIVEGEAPDKIDEFPAPDKVFIGGSTGKAGEIIDICLQKNPKAVIVVNAIALETISNTLTLFKERDLETTVQCANVSTAKKLGRYNLMMADNPVYIIKGYKATEKGGAENEGKDIT